jgi:triosephosphate isomerase (TIM)
MRGKFIAGNWKMNTNWADALALATRVASGVSKHPQVTVALCPPFPYLSAVRGAIEGSAVQMGAQNLSTEPSGAFTGEVSGAMLVDVGCRYCIVGHSERRHIIGESDAVVRRKIKAALQVGLQPIVCVGELLAERDGGETKEVVAAQVCSAVAGLTEPQFQNLLFAYEPVWAIGTGRNATPDQAEEVHSHIRKILTDCYNASLAAQTVIQYGGSVRQSNAESLLAQPNIDGALVGGASLNADEFLAIAAAATRLVSR